MRYIIGGLTFVLISIIVNGIFAWLKQSKQTADRKVHLPKFFAILGTIVSAGFLILAIVAGVVYEAWVASVLFLLCASGSAALIIGFVNCRISYDENGFVSKNFFGIKRHYTYDQVTAFKENAHETFLYVGKKRIMIDEFSIGGDDFMKHVRKAYRTLHDGQPLPKVHKSKHDIFNGNVKESGGFLFVYIAVSIMVVGLLGFFVYYVYFTPCSPDNTLEESVYFVSCTASGEDVVLMSDDNKTYKIRFIDKQVDVNTIRALCDAKTTVTVYSEEITPDHEEDYYSVKAIVHNGETLLSFEETNRLHRQEYALLVVFGVVLCLAWAATVVFSVIVGKNPKRFNKRIVRLFFKEGYINE